ncbi:MAG: methyl-accepting chemotaxis protein [Planctomycetota bacterium]
MKLTIGQKLACGFGVMTALVVLVSAVIYLQAGVLNEKTDGAIEENVPAVENGLIIQGEIHHALSMHRGYMILGLQALAEERLDAWDKIGSASAEMDRLSATWTDQSAIDDWAKAKRTLNDLRSAQDRIAAVSHTPDDHPADKLFFDDAGPYGEEMIRNLQAILDLEEQEAATPERKQLVRRISAAEGHLLKARYAIAAFLVSGDGLDQARVSESVDSCQASVDRLMTMTELLTPAQTDYFDAYINARTEFLTLAKKAVAIRAQPGFCISEDICLNTVAPLSQEADQLLAGIVQSQARAKGLAVEEIHAASASMVSMVIFATLGAVLIGTAVAFFLSRQIVGALGKIIEFTKALARKDLTVDPIDVRTGDNLQDLAGAMNEMHTSLRGIIADVSRTAQEVASTSTQISSSNEEIANGVAAQAGQVEQISAAITEMTASVGQVAEQSDQASENAEQSTQLATEGGDVVQETISGMNSIREAVSGSAASVGELGKRSEQIGEIINVINDIADQTNLLALNAAIEAARAGEHGRGFAVVADEVRKLAERTQVATEEVSESVRAIQNETAVAVERMERGTEEVSRGVELASSAGQSLGSIYTGTQGVTSMIREIASAAEEQARTAEDVTRGITEIGNAAQTASRGTQEASAASRQLSEKAEKLRALVEQFRL